MKACIIFLAVSAFLGAAYGAEPRKSCLKCSEQSLWPICAIEFRINRISVKTFATRCEMDKYNCEHNTYFIEFFAGACEGPNINT